MAFDFPNNPTSGQIVVGPGGAQYRWDTVKWTPVTLTSPVALNDVGRNVLHNGLFNVQQRGQGPFTTGVITADRWYNDLGPSDTMSTTIVALADADRAAIGDEAARYALQVVFTGSAAGTNPRVGVFQDTEYVRRLSGKTITVSFWAKATSGTPAIGYGWQQGLTSPSYPYGNIGKTPPLTTAWQRYNGTVTLPSTSGATIDPNWDTTMVELVLSSPSTNTATYALSGNLGVQSGTVQIFGVQTEVGSVMTQLEKPDPAVEWTIARRFYQAGQLQWYDYAPFAGMTVAMMYQFPTGMRVQPTITTNFTSQTNGSSITMNAASQYAFQLSFTVPAVGAFNVAGNYAASADL